MVVVVVGIEIGVEVGCIAEALVGDERIAKTLLGECCRRSAEGRVRKRGVWSIAAVEIVMWRMWLRHILASTMVVVGRKNHSVKAGIEERGWTGWMQIVGMVVALSSRRCKMDCSLKRMRLEGRSASL